MVDQVIDASDENTRPLTQQERQVLQRHQQIRDNHLAEAQEQQNILIELVTLIGGEGAEVDLGEGTISLPVDEDKGDEGNE